MGKTVFVTVGTTQFDRLIETIFAQESNVMQTMKHIFQLEKLIIQAGRSPMPDKIPSDINIEFYQYKDSIADDIERADLVISHAGAGSILQCLEAHKPLLVVVNEMLMNNHQFEIAEQMEKENYLLHCTCSTLNDGLKKIATHHFNTYETGNPMLFGEYLNRIFIDRNK